MPDVSSQVAIRPCHSHAEWDECVKLQSKVWQYSDADLLPSALLLVAVETGGQLFGAFSGNHLIGFCLALVGYQDRVRYLHSAITVISPEFQNQGVGRMLKSAQRQDGISRGFDHMEWTFDPLQLRNAYFSIVTLGAVSRQYLPDFYGQTSSPLHRGMATDRLLAEWRWNSPASADALRKEISVHGQTRRIPLSSNSTDLRSQTELRNELQTLFQDGWVITSVERVGKTGAYILSHRSDVERKSADRNDGI
jgi:predicted GNAT superfamily acetyltransferase